MNFLWFEVLKILSGHRLHVDNCDFVFYFGNKTGFVGCNAHNLSFSSVLSKKITARWLECYILILSFALFMLVKYFYTLSCESKIIIIIIMKRNLRYLIVNFTDLISYSVCWWQFCMHWTSKVSNVFLVPLACMHHCL